MKNTSSSSSNAYTHARMHAHSHTRNLGMTAGADSLPSFSLPLSVALSLSDYFDSPRFDRCAFTEDVDEFLTALGKLYARGGDDAPEDMINGLEEALLYDWSPPTDEKVTRLMLLIADAPCHGAQFSSGDSEQSKEYLKAHPEDPAATLQKIARAGIRLTFCRITSETDKCLEAFQGWYDDRRRRKVMNILQLGQSVNQLLPMLVEQLTLAALGRKPVTAEATAAAEGEEAAAAPAVEEKGEEDEPEIIEASDAQEPAAKRAKTVKKKGAPQAMLSLAGKWAPTERSHFDAGDLKFAGTLARLLFPPSEQAAAAGAGAGAGVASSKSWQNSASKQYRLLLSTLRTELAVVEKFMCSQRWNSIDFPRVPARASKLLKNAFQKHAAAEYGAFLGRVKRGEVVIKSAGIQPHEFIEEYRRAETVKEDETTELQWKAMVAKVRASVYGSSSEGDESKRNHNALCILDTSGSMTWNASGVSSHNGREGGAMDNKMSSVCPIDAGIALTLLASELSSGPFKDKVITFSDSPSWVALPSAEEASLCKRVDALYSASGNGGSTDLSKALRLILQVAKDSKCAQQDLPRTLFVLSDMQLSQATGIESSSGAGALDWSCGSDSSVVARPSALTDLKAIGAEFKTAGLEMPQIVLWNLAAPAAKAEGRYGGGAVATDESLVPGVSMDESSGVALLSGYSASLVSLALKQELRLQPMTLLTQAVLPYAHMVNIDEAER